MASNATNRREQLRQQQEAAARQSKRTSRIIAAIAGLLALVLIGVLVYAFVSQPPAASGPA